VEEISVEVSLPPTDSGSAERLMLKEDAVREIISRVGTGGEDQGDKRGSLELDRKTIKRWRSINFLKASILRGR
jgi:hypothetical protein